MAALFCSAVLIMVSAHFHHPTEAVPMTDWNRVLTAFNRSYDPCRDVNASTSHAIRAFADALCDEAFKALTRLRLNTCTGWEDAKCRVIGGEQHAQCTCKISYLDDRLVLSSTVTAFRECAKDLRDRELISGQVLAPTVNVQEARSSYDGERQVNSLQLDLNHPAPHDRAGRSTGVSTAGGVGSSSGIHATGGASSSRNVHAAGIESSPWDAYTSAFADPSTALPTYAPGTSGTKHSRRGSKWLDIHKLPRPHACDKCKDTFRSARDLLVHKKAHREGETHCDECNFTYSSRRTYFKHLRKRHPTTVAEKKASRAALVDQGEADVTLPYPCEFCSRRFATRDGLMSHMKSHTTEQTKCIPCGLTFSTRGIYKRHMLNTHPGVDIPRLKPAGDQGSENFVCSECGKPYQSRQTLREHQKSHRTLETYCGYCDKILATKDGYWSHLKRRHSEFVGAEEGRAQKQYLDEHPIACEQCPKRYKNERGLRDHMPVHEGKTRCPECNAFFSRMSYLTAHIRSEHPK